MEEVFDLLNVLAATVAAASAVGLLYSFGLKLHWVWQDAGAGTARKGARMGSLACYAGCVVVLIVALVLMVVS